MHAVVVDVSIDDPQSARRELHDRVVPAVSQAPGLVAGYWIDRGEGKGLAVMIFETERAATAAAEHVGQSASSGVTLDTTAVHPVVAEAHPPVPVPIG